MSDRLTISITITLSLEIYKLSLLLEHMNCFCNWAVEKESNEIPNFYHNNGGPVNQYYYNYWY